MIAVYISVKLNILKIIFIHLNIIKISVKTYIESADIIIDCD